MRQISVVQPIVVVCEPARFEDPNQQEYGKTRSFRQSEQGRQDPVRDGGRATAFLSPCVESFRSHREQEHWIAERRDRQDDPFRCQALQLGKAPPYIRDVLENFCRDDDRERSGLQRQVFRVRDVTPLDTGRFAGAWRAAAHIVESLVSRIKVRSVSKKLCGLLCEEAIRESPQRPRIPRTESPNWPLAYPCSYGEAFLDCVQFMRGKWKTAS